MNSQTEDIFEKLGKAAKKAGETTARVTAETAETIGQGVKVLELKSEIRNLLYELGKTVYAAHRENGLSGDVGEQLATLDNRYAALKECQKKACEKRRQVCTACGSACGNGDRFCRKCGMTL